MLCYCDSNHNYDQCCGPVITFQNAQTPEQLMRSRYSAYCQANIAYIAATMAGSASENFNSASALQWARSVKWLGLQVLKTPPALADQGLVEFQCKFIDGNMLCHIHEMSEFKKINAKWYYTDGQLLPTPNQKLMPNQLCPCGSQKKFKKCCAQ